MDNIRGEVRGFVEKHLAIYDDQVEFGDGDNIFAFGFVDSMFALQLVRFIQKQFGVKVDRKDLRLENFQSVDNIVGFVTDKQGG